MGERCSFIKSDGQPCRAFCKHGEATCLFHSDRSGGQSGAAVAAAPMSTKEKRVLLENEIRHIRRRSKIGIERGKLLIALLEKLDNLPPNVPDRFGIEEPADDSPEGRVRKWKSQQSAS
jgi:hypothetical protein